MTSFEYWCDYIQKRGNFEYEETKVRTLAKWKVFTDHYLYSLLVESYPALSSTSKNYIAIKGIRISLIFIEKNFNAGNVYLKELISLRRIA